jgi:aspartate/tyrosine/aromatic aminotransferase
MPCFVFNINYLNNSDSVDGLEGFDDVSKELLLGDNNPLVNSGRVFTIQTLSGTGALRLAFDFLYCFMSQNKITGSATVVYYPSTTWANHPDILKASHFPGLQYRYLDSTGCHLDFEGLCEDLNNAEPNSIFLFHMCGHNPTGMFMWTKYVRCCVTRT